MNQDEFENLCEELLPSCVVFLNPLKKGNSPESDDEFDSNLTYIPSHFDEKRIPIHINIQNAFRVCFVDGDWLELGKEIFVTRRTLGDNRLTVLTGKNFINELRILEINIGKFLETLYPTYEFPRRTRFHLNVKEPKIVVGTKNGILLLAFPREDDDLLVYGFLESLRNFGNEMVLKNLMGNNINFIEPLREPQEVKISNKTLEIQSSIPLDDDLNISIFHFNPDDIYDEINKRTIDIARGFCRATLRRTGLLDKKFSGRMDIYRTAFRKPIFGGVSAEELLNRAQKHGDEILTIPLLSETFREITRELNYPKKFELLLLNSLNANIFAIDYNHSFINNQGLIEFTPEFIEKLRIYRSKINRVVSSKVINSAHLDFGDKKCRIFRLESLMKIENLEISPSLIEPHVCYLGDWDTISETHENNKLVIKVLENGIIQLSDPIHIRPNINEKGERITRIVKIKQKSIQLPDFSFLTLETRKKLRVFIRDNVSDILKTPLDSLLKVIAYAKEDLGLISQKP